MTTWGVITDALEVPIRCYNDWILRDDVIPLCFLPLSANVEAYIFYNLIDSFFGDMSYDELIRGGLLTYIIFDLKEYFSDIFLHKVILLKLLRMLTAFFQMTQKVPFSLKQSALSIL